MHDKPIDEMSLGERSEIVEGLAIKYMVKTPEFIELMAAIDEVIYQEGQMDITPPIRLEMAKEALLAKVVK